MSKTTGHTGHATTNGEAARYLEAENPNVPPEQLHDRFQRWRDGEELPRIRANYCCPRCGSSDVYYTDERDVSRCDSCGEVINERAHQISDR